MTAAVRKKALALDTGRESRRIGCGRRARFAYMAITPAMVVVLVIMVYPVLYNVRLAFTDYNWFLPMEETMNWVGLSNFRWMVGSRFFWRSVSITAIFIFGGAILQYIAALLLALLLHSEFPARGFFRAAFMIPMMMSPLIAGIQWRWLLSGQFGIVPHLIRSLGLGSPGWLSDPRIALYTVIVVDTWRETPFIALTLLAALQSISADILEAAVMDGASYRRQLWHIVLPMLIPASLLAVVIRMTGALKTFGLIHVLTRGGPARATEILGLHAYYISFNTGEIARGATVAVAIGLVALGLSLVLLRLIQTEGSRL